jgi:hypothetical protein
MIFDVLGSVNAIVYEVVVVMALVHPINVFLVIDVTSKPLEARKLRISAASVKKKYKE